MESDEESWKSITHGGYQGREHIDRRGRKSGSVFLKVGRFVVVAEGSGSDDRSAAYELLDSLDLKAVENLE